MKPISELDDKQLNSQFTAVAFELTGRLSGFSRREELFREKDLAALSIPELRQMFDELEGESERRFRLKMK